MKTDTIICGDNVQTLATFPDESIDLTVTSPPYDNLRTYNGFTWDFEALARQLYRVTKQGGVVVWVVGDATVNGSETGTSFRQALYFMECGFNLHDTMIYRTTKPPLTHNRYEQEFEYMFVFSKDAPKTFNPIKALKDWIDSRKVKLVRRERDGSWDVGAAGKSKHKICGNVWNINTGGFHTSQDKIAFEHPAIFPEALARDHILSWSNPGDIVLDPFIGSGTTAKMAKESGRHWIGIDISDEYCKLAEKRVKGANVPLFT